MYTLVMNQDRARLIQSQKMSAAGNLLAGIVHELNSPLTTILGFSELLLKDGNSADPSRLEKIHSEAERSVRLAACWRAFHVNTPGASVRYGWMGVVCGRLKAKTSK